MKQDARICGFGRWMCRVMVGGYLLSAPGVYAGEGVDVRAGNYASALVQGEVVNRDPVNAITPHEATLDHPFVNSLGMKFVPVPDPDGRGPMLFSIWPTRVRDFRAFVEDGENHDYDYRHFPGRHRGIPTLVSKDDYYMPDFYYYQMEYGWDNPGFDQSEDHPVTCICWADVEFFCTWLTKQEQQAGHIPTNWIYRLPTDMEWSLAVGLKSEAGGTPKAKNSSPADLYPWGQGWPPPPDAGNYAGEEVNEVESGRSFESIPGYRDDYPRTSPVGLVGTNRYGLFDMGGNLWELCHDLYNPEPHERGKLYEGSLRTARGASWADSDSQRLALSHRIGIDQHFRFDYVGFRLVLTPATP